MITEEELGRIREYLQKSENPLFFYDDDPDGLASFLLLKKYIGRGKGVAIRSAPAMEEVYLRKITEYSPDYVFILDKPVMTQDFIDKVSVPIIYIDHHPVQELKGVKYFNPRIHDDADNRPTSYWCYRVTSQDLWIAMCGIIGDWHVPEFMGEFVRQYPDLVKESKDAGEILFETQFGKLVKVFAFLLKGSTTEVKKNVSVLEKIKTPYEILSQSSSKGRFIYKHFENINKIYEGLLEKARKEVTKSKLLVFIYPSSKHSLTGTLSNELLFLYPDKMIVIGRRKEDKVVMSFRSMRIKVLPLLKIALEGVDGYGGGHDHACGGGVNVDDFDKFIENLKKQL